MSILYILPAAVDGTMGRLMAWVAAGSAAAGSAAAAAAAVSVVVGIVVIRKINYEVYGLITLIA